MRRPFFLFAAFLMALPLFAAERSASFDDGGGLATDCSAMSFRYDGERVPFVTEDVPVGNVSSLRVRSSQHGGIRVIGGSGAYSVRACKWVASGDASRVRVSLSGNEVSVDGPENDNWMVFLIVQTPRNATLDVDAGNGPVSVREFDGTLTAHVENGPLSIKSSGGTIDATAVNGPISLAGGSGNVKLAATNGPISVKLEGTSWAGGNLDAKTTNGPVSLKVPRGFRSGVVAESLGRGPVSCRAEDCPPRTQSFDERPKRIELGSGPSVIHLSTVNGPVSIKNID